MIRKTFGILIGLAIILNFIIIGSYIYEYVGRYELNQQNIMESIAIINRTDARQTEILNGLIEKQTNYIDKIDITDYLNTSVTVLGKSGLGSGTIIKKTEDYMLVLSCYHIIADIVESEDAEKNYFICYTHIKEERDNRYNFGSRIYEAKLIKYDKENDMILLKVEVNDVNLKALKISDVYPKIGDTIYTIGNPLGLERTVSRGIISNILNGFYVTDGTITYGNSGGSLINNNGELIGIPSRVLGYSALVTVIPESGLGQSITLNRIKKFLEDTEMEEKYHICGD